MTTRISALEAFPPGSRRTVLHGGAGVLVLHLAEGLFAVQSECPHAGAPLQSGPVHDCVLRCPLHSWHFSLHTGRLVTTPVGPALKRYRVAVEEGYIVVGEELATEGEP